MLSTNEYEAMQQQLAECNCTYEEKDPRELRKGGTGMAHSRIKLAQALSEDTSA